MYDLDWQDIPVFICNRNNFDRGFKRLVAWLLSMGMKKITIVDNQSSYPPLLAFYEEMKDRITVDTQVMNIGPRGWWALGNHMKIDTPYIYSDCDVVPSFDCPQDVIEKLLGVLGTQEPPVGDVHGGRKVGVSLRTDNLPDCFTKKDMVIKWESGFWNPDRRVDPTLTYGLPVFSADVDTTFAMYHPRQPFTYTALRTDAPYSFEHIPWYNDEANPTEEDKFYREHYETAHEGGQMWKTDQGGYALYGWNVRSKASMEETFKARGIELDGKPRW